MHSDSRRRFLRSTLLVCLVLAGGAALHAQLDINAWHRWETELTAAGSYTNLYKNHELRVTWTCLSDCSSAAFGGRLPLYGFWDGTPTAPKRFKIRAAFPQPISTDSARWRWTTSCVTTGADTNCSGDSGLTTSGEVTVWRSNAARGVTNPLYLGGAFGIAEGNASEGGVLVRGNMHLYNDNGPFYWQGDTAWNAPIRARFNAGSVPNCTLQSGWDSNDWKCYIQDRVAKQFTAIHISVPQRGMSEPKTELSDVNNQKPFEGASFDKWNPIFWQGFEDKIQYANEQGLVVFVVGLMEPYHSNTANRQYPSQADAVLFARNLTARLSGNFVILSPAFDSVPDGVTSPLIRAVGNAIHGVSPRPVITNHFGGSTPTIAAGADNDYSDFNAEPWLDVYLFQSGQSIGLRSDPPQQLQRITERARKMGPDLRALSFRKAVANVESVYDFDNLILKAGTTMHPEWQKNYKPYRIRQTAYLSTLTGSFGYSLGVTGLWDWGRGSGDPYQPRMPRNSVTTASATQIRHLGNLFRQHRWNWLAPALIVRNNPAEAGNQHLQMVASRDLTRRSTLAYLPDNAEIRLELIPDLYPSFLTARWSKRWYNPRTGAFQGATASQQAGTNIFIFPRPLCGTGCSAQNGDADWVLELIDTTQGAAFARAADGSSLQVSSSFDEATETWAITGQRVDSNGVLLGDGILISDDTRAVQRLPLVTRAADGSYVVVWEAESLDGDHSGVFARRIGANGQLLGAVQRVNETTAGRQFEPVLASDASGGVVIAWTDVDPSTDTVRIVGRRFTTALAPLGPELAVSATASSVSRRAPLIAADVAGNFLVAWQEYDTHNGASTILARRFDANGTAEEYSHLIESSSSHYLALERLELEPTGNFRVIWQHVADGTSRGHYSRSFDARKGAVGRQVVVGAEPE